MPAVQYPFIDIAVHPRIRERFARGEAMALFSAGLDRVLWANGAGAGLFGYPAIYDFIEQGARQGDVSFRQVASTAHQLAAVGDTRSFLIRIAAGFQRIVVNATVEMVRIQAGETAILFSCPVSSKELDTPARARQMLEGFDDPDTHMAVIGRDGEIVASSSGFNALGMTPQTASMLVAMASAQPERMVKRPIPTGQGYLPAAIGRLSDSPALHLLFVVEMVIGHLDPVDHGTPAPAAEPAVVSTPPAEISAPDLVTEEHVPSSSDLNPIASDVAPEPEVEHRFPEDALAGMLEAIPAAHLPSEPAVGDDAVVADAALHQDPELTTEAAEAPPEMLAAIPANDLPAEAAIIHQQDKKSATEHTDAHDLGPETVRYLMPPAMSLPEAVSAAELQPFWVTSEIPPVISAELSSLLQAPEEHAPETTALPHDGEVTEIPAVQAVDLAHYGTAETHAPQELLVPAEATQAHDTAFTAMIDAVAGIEDLDDAPEDLGDEQAQATSEIDGTAAVGGEPLVAHIGHPIEVPVSAPEIPSSLDALADDPEAHNSDTAGAQDSHTVETEGVAPEVAAHIQEHAPIEEAVATNLVEEPQSVESGLLATAEEFATEEAHHSDAAGTENRAEGQEAIEAAATNSTDIFSSESPTEQSAGESTSADTTEAHSSAGMTNELEAPIEEPVAHEAAESAASVDAEASGTEYAIPEEGSAPAAELPAEHIVDAPAVIDATENAHPVEAQAGDEGTAETEANPSGDTSFVFNRNGRATRFVWKIDAEGRFSEISREFAEAVGPHAKSVAGVAFSDIAALFNLDPDGKISELLARRDTWSGRTIHWPVEGTTLTVPVDLAALPTYTRSREFDGFRGFGVVRLSDAAEDPQKIGLTLTSEVAETEATPSDVNGALPVVEPVAASTAEDEAEATVSQHGADTSDIDASAHEETPPASEEPELPFNGEPPALKISATPSRRLSDKIIQLHQHRLNISDSLSPSEQAAFREIAKQLEPFGKRGEVPVEADAQETPISADHSFEPETADEALQSHVAANDDNKGAQESSSAEPAEKADGEFDPLAALSTAIPPRSKMTDGLSAEVVDQLPVAVLVHAGDTLIHANPEFLRLTGYKNLGEVEGIGGLDALLQRQDLQDKTERPGSMVVVRADDVLVPVTARLQSIRWEDSSALMLALMPVDKDSGLADTAARTDSRDEARPERMLEKVAKLQVEVEELQSILETATDGVAIIGPEGDIRSMNRSASALFNYDEQETRGKPFVMLFAHESQKAVLDYLNGLTGNGVASVLNDGREVIGREASGGFVPLFMTMGVLTSSNGYCAVIRDITQWKRTEEELRNAKRAAETANAHKTDFLARVSHEIRTPLNAIIGFSDMMASERLGPMGHARYVEYAGDIGRSGRHVLDIVNDLLDISKIEAGEMDLEFGSVGLNAAIAEAVAIVQPQANGQRVIIRTALAQSVPNVVADLRSIKQIALNILSNAIRFTPSGGQIVVSTSYEGNGSVVLRIRDTGVGMTRTELEQAMKPFRQVATNSRQRGDGTGLGLPLTKAMVDANRAIFAIHSAPNEGTLVEVTFPSQRVLAN